MQYQNYQLYRTNPRLSGQIKWNLILEPNKRDLMVNGFYLTPISKNIPFLVQDKNLLNYKHEENVKNMFHSISNSFYDSTSKIFIDNSLSTMSNIFEKDYDDEYEMGCRRASYQMYNKQFEFFCPVWLETIDGDLNFQFEIYPSLTSKTPMQIKNLILKQDMMYTMFHNKFVNYFNNYVKYMGLSSDSNYKGSDDLIYIDLNKNKSYITGLNASTGINGIKNLPHLAHNLTNRERPLLDFDNLIISNFESNKMITKQLFNFSFFFNIEDLVPNNFLHMIYGDKFIIKVKVGMNDKFLELKDFYSNYNFIPNKYCNYDSMVEFEKSITDEHIINVNFKSIYDKSKTLKGFDMDQNWSERIDNVLSYLQDYNYIDHIDKNKLTQPIIHWSLADNNDYIFNLYNGFGGILESVDEENLHYYQNENNKKIPDNEIWYTSINGDIVTPSFNVPIISNTYKNGKGIIIFEDTLTNINAGAFTGCVKIKTITLPNKITSIGDFSFFNCYNLTDINIPNSVVSIETRAFENCQNLNSVIFGENVRYIGDYAFWRCPNLSTIYINSEKPIQLGFNSLLINEKMKIYVIVKSYQDYVENDSWSQYKNLLTPYIKDSMDLFYKIPHMYANTPNLSVKDYDEHSNNIRWCNIVKMETKNYEDKLFISSAIEYFILQNQKYYSKFGDKKWVKNIYYTASELSHDINTIVLETDIDGENDDICKYLFKSSNYSDLIQRDYFIGHLVLNNEKIGLVVIGDDVNQIPSITMILYKNMLKKITISNFKNIKFHDENNTPINWFYEPVKNRYNEYLYDTINVKYITYFYELQNILASNFSLPFVVLLNKSIRVVRGNSPSQKTTECYYIKHPYSPSYMLRYSGKIKPTFISKDSISNGYFNFKFYKKYAKDLNEIKDNNVLEETNFNAKYPSINYYPLIKRIQKYDIIDEYNYEDYNVLNDDSIKYNYTDLNFFNDNYMYVLKPQMDVKLHSKKDEFGNYVKLKDLIKEYLIDFYNINRENDTIKQKTVDYIFNQYTYTSTFDYASNDIKDIDNYIYDVKIILK